MAGKLSKQQIAILVIVGVAVLAVGGYLVYRKIDGRKSKPKSSTPQQAAAAASSSSTAGAMPSHAAYSNQDTRYDLMEGGRRRSGKATGYSADDEQLAYNQNLVGSVQAPHDLKVGSSRTSYPSAPMGSKPVSLQSTRLSGARRGKNHTGGAKTTAVDLSSYSRMGVDRSMGAQGLDLPEDLALASAQLGHTEVTAPTRTDSQHPWGETPYSWDIGYSVTTSGQLEPGNGIIPNGYGPSSLALRQRGVSY